MRLSVKISTAIVLAGATCLAFWLHVYPAWNVVFTADGINFQERMRGFACGLSTTWRRVFPGRAASTRTRFILAAQRPRPTPGIIWQVDRMAGGLGRAVRRFGGRGASMASAWVPANPFETAFLACADPIERVIK
jgi:hypothetical protein